MVRPWNVVFTLSICITYHVVSRLLPSLYAKCITLAKGLFHRSIQQSGECAVGMFAPGANSEVGVRTKHTRHILDLFNASSVDELANATLYPAECHCSVLLHKPHWMAYSRWMGPSQATKAAERTTLQRFEQHCPYRHDCWMQLLTIRPFSSTCPPSDFISMAMNMETEIYGIFRL